MAWISSVKSERRHRSGIKHIHKKVLMPNSEISKSSSLFLFINKSLFGCLNKENFQGKVLHCMSLFAFVCVVFRVLCKKKNLQCVIKFSSNLE